MKNTTGFDLLSLDRFIIRKLNEARRMERKTRNEGYYVEDYGPQSWEGYVAALVAVRAKIKRIKQTV